MECRDNKSRSLYRDVVIERYFQITSPNNDVYIYSLDEEASMYKKWKLIYRSSFPYKVTVPSYSSPWGVRSLEGVLINVEAGEAKMVELSKEETFIAML